MKTTVLAESSLYFIFSPGSLHYSDVDRHESGRCRNLLFFLTFFIKFPCVICIFYPETSSFFQYKFPLVILIFVIMSLVLMCEERNVSVVNFKLYR
jgi:hypothetical protein